MSLHAEIEDVAEELRSLAAAVRRQPVDVNLLAAKLRSAADELEDLAVKAHRREP